MSRRSLAYTLVLVSALVASIAVHGWLPPLPPSPLVLPREAHAIEYYPLLASSNTSTVLVRLEEETDSQWFSNSSSTALSSFSDSASLNWLVQEPYTGPVNLTEADGIVFGIIWLEQDKVIQIDLNVHPDLTVCFRGMCGPASHFRLADGGIN